MGRKSKLTPQQWAEIERRMLAGEPRRALAREFGIGESTLRGMKSAHVNQIKDVANQLVAAERAVMALPITAQVVTRNRAALLLSIEDNVLGGAVSSSATFLRLSAMANSELQKVNDASPMEDDGGERLKLVAGIQRMANDACAVPSALLASNKERINRVADAAEVIENEPTNIASIPVLEAAKAYQDFISG